MSFKEGKAISNLFTKGINITRNSFFLSTAKGWIFGVLTPGDAVIRGHRRDYGHLEVLWMDQLVSMWADIHMIRGSIAREDIPHPAARGDEAVCAGLPGSVEG
jgi:hypothetical protein